MLSFLHRTKAPQRSIKIFVASPGDTATLRTAVHDAATDLNRTELRKHGTALDVLRWETDTIPSTGAYPQDAINAQIEYDILIVIFRKRFGTPTELANSGTEEEFERAYNRLIAIPGSVQILTYFSDETFRLSEIDPHQWLRLSTFRDTVARRGVLSHTYSSVDDFKAQVRKALLMVAGREAISPEAPGARAATTPDQVVQLNDWRIATQKLYPQWATFREIPIIAYKGRDIALLGTFYCKSPYFRFGYKTFSAEGGIFGRETVQTSDPNCLVHLGLNKDRPELFLSPYINGNRVAANIDVANYGVRRPLKLQFRMQADGRNQVYVEDRLVYEVYSPEKFRERLALVAWGDHDEYLIDFTGVSLTASMPSRPK